MIHVRSNDFIGYLTELFNHMPEDTIQQINLCAQEAYAEANTVIYSLEINGVLSEETVDDPKFNFLVNFKDFTKMIPVITYAALTQDSNQ